MHMLHMYFDLTRIQNVHKISRLPWFEVKKNSIIYVALKNRENSGLDNHMVQRGKSSRSKKTTLTEF